jgi:hypothetical protein
MTDTSNTNPQAQPAPFDPAQVQETIDKLEAAADIARSALSQHAAAVPVTPLRFILVKEDDEADRCSPLSVLAALSEINLLGRFRAAIAPDKIYGGLGNCHEACFALLADLAQAGQVNGWKWAAVRVAPKGELFRHSWLEYDGWAIDCGRGDGLVFFRKIRAYRKLMKPRGLKLRNHLETATHIFASNARAGV